MDSAAVLTTLIGYPVALCVFAFLIFVVVRAAVRSALREHRAALVAELGPLQAPAAAPAPTGTVSPQEPGTGALSPKLATTELADPMTPSLLRRDAGRRSTAA